MSPRAHDAGAGITAAEARREARACIRTWLALLALLVLSMASALVDLGWLNAVLNLGIATAKALLILWVFMHVREMTPLLRVFALGALLWLGFLVVIGMGDWATRGLV